MIFRATPQWFISMEKTGLRQQSLAAIDQVAWIPSWGRERIYGMIENRPDWCVSRQRAWGVPIAVFYCEQCEALLLDDEIMEKIYDLFETYGADVWFEKSIDELLPAGTVCDAMRPRSVRKRDRYPRRLVRLGGEPCGRAGTARRPQWPADLYLEGSDQHRGWFHSSLLSSVGTRGRAPYNAVLTHGFVVDANGHKMSKSLGNIVAPKEVIKRYGAEILRLVGVGHRLPGRHPHFRKHPPAAE